MDFKRCARPILFSLAALACAACATPTIPDELQLEQPLPEHYALAFPPAAVWAEVADMAPPSPEGRVLGVDEDQRVISWVTLVERKAESHASLADEKVTKSGTVPAITVIQVLEATAGTDLLLRQVYFPDKTAAGISHSRGDFERTFLAELNGRLAGSGGAGR